MKMFGGYGQKHWGKNRGKIMKLIVWRGGGPTDATEDYEFTDWDALAKFVDSFIEMATCSAPNFTP